jgi:hypothetical protein
MSTHGIARRVGLVVGLVIMWQGVVFGASESEVVQGNGQFSVELTDGSSVICRPVLVELPFKTSYAEMKLPLLRVQMLEIDPKTAKMKVLFLNGDQIQGSCPLTELAVTWLLGELTLPVATITRATTTLKLAPVFEDTPERRNACINNLRQLDSAKEQWAMASNKGLAAAVDIKMVNQYIRGSRTPTCAAGGTYNYQVIGTPPECNVPGHSLHR